MLTFQRLKNRLGETLFIPIDVTYEELTDKIATASLLPNQAYRIIDFATTRMVGACTDGSYHTGPVEPLIIWATTPNTIEYQAVSEQHPFDVIYYTVVAPIECDSTVDWGISFPHTGHIFYRKDTIRNISSWEDWRNVKSRRWESVEGSGFFREVYNSGYAYQDLPMFTNWESIAHANIEIGRPATLIGVAGVPLNEPSAIVFDSRSNFAPYDLLNVPYTNISIGNGCWNIQFLGGGNDISIGHECYMHVICLNYGKIGDRVVNIQCSLDTIFLYLEVGDYTNVIQLFPSGDGTGRGEFHKIGRECYSIFFSGNSNRVLIGDGCYQCGAQDNVHHCTISSFSESIVIPDNTDHQNF